MPTPKLKEALATWEGLNTFLRTASEKQAKQLLDMERKGKRRIQYLMRTHARFNRERAQRERTELLRLD